MTRDVRATASGATGAWAAPAPAEAVHARLARAGAVARACLALTKPRIVELLLVTTVPTMLLAARGTPSLRVLAATLVGGALSAGGANASNMVWDRDLDAKMSRTARRPLVTGAISVRAATVFAVTLEAASLGVLWGEVNLLAALLSLGAAAFYVFVYTAWLKRSTPQNIVIGGVAGAAPALVAWAAVTGKVSAPAWVLFGVIVLWTPPHFWALAIRYRDDYATAGVPMLPVVTDVRRVADQILVYSVAVVGMSFALVPVAAVGWVYPVGAAVLGVMFVGKAAVLRARPTRQAAMSLFHYSILYHAVLFALVALAAVVPR